jgi:hypothetical protein
MFLANALLVLALAGEGELVLGLAIRDLVDTEPLVGGPQETGKVALDILNVVELGSKRVIDVNDNDLPVSLLFVEESHDTEDLDLLDLTRLADKLANLAHIQWVVVSLGLGLWVNDIWVFPSLCGWLTTAGSHEERGLRRTPYLGEGAVVPEIALVGEAVAHIAELALLDVLLDGVEGLLLADLRPMSVGTVFCLERGREDGGEAAATHLHLRIRPAGDLDDHVEDRLLLIGIEGDVVEGRDGDAILLDEDAVLEGVGSADLAGSVWAGGRHGGRRTGRRMVEVGSDLLGTRTNFELVGERDCGGGGGGAGRGGLFIGPGQCEERHPKSFALDSARSRRRK